MKWGNELSEDFRISNLKWGTARRHVYINGLLSQLSQSKSGRYIGTRFVGATAYGGYVGNNSNKNNEHFNESFLSSKNCLIYELYACPASTSEAVEDTTKSGCIL